MSCHPQMVTREELDQVVKEEISDPLGVIAEIRVYRKSSNSVTVVVCNGIPLTASSNYEMKCLIMDMKRAGTLLEHFQQKCFSRKA